MLSSELTSDGALSVAASPITTAFARSTAQEANPRSGSDVLDLSVSGRRSIALGGVSEVPIVCSLVMDVLQDDAVLVAANDTIARVCARLDSRKQRVLWHKDALSALRQASDEVRRADCAARHAI